MSAVSDLINDLRVLRDSMSQDDAMRLDEVLLDYTSTVLGEDETRLAPLASDMGSVAERRAAVRAHVTDLAHTPVWLRDELRALLREEGIV